MNEKILEALRASLERIQEERRGTAGGSAGALLFCKEEDVRLAVAAQEAVIEEARGSSHQPKGGGAP